MGPLIAVVVLRSGVAGVESLLMKSASLLSFVNEPNVKVEEDGDPI